MRYRSKKTCSLLLRCQGGFSLVEVICAVAILGITSFGVFVVIDRCIVSTADLTTQMHAFEIARNNMEKLLASKSVKEKVEFGTSEKYPQIQWQTTVETFYEPVTSKMWARAVCSAEYTDSKGEIQPVEMTHWLNKLTDKQVELVNELKEREKVRLAQQRENETEPEQPPPDEDEDTLDPSPDAPNDFPWWPF